MKKRKEVKRLKMTKKAIPLKIKTSKKVEPLKKVTLK
jgi:hypothetical protein